MQERICVVANVHSLVLGTRKSFDDKNMRVSYPKMMSDIKKGRRFLEGVACVLGVENDQELFLDMLNSVGLKPTLRGEVNELRDFFSSQMIKLSFADTLVLVTGDPAILPIIDYLEETNRKPKIELWYFGEHIDDDLHHGVDEVKEFSDRHIFKKVV